ncbi:AAEL017203-PA [Aedes aegypti]|uniref:AAEL017203-PA n=1 Tax=Aedes aegypti TaxID=7159 RepID=J9HHJ3_AEDAE|nr:AAEL017203-PA [Aedes aegypti]
MLTWTISMLYKVYTGRIYISLVLRFIMKPQQQITCIVHRTVIIRKRV